MAIDSYMIFVRYGDKPLDAESQVVLGKGTPEALATDGGFKFADYNGESLLLAIKHALQAFKDKSAWQNMMRNGMKKDFSWEKSAKEYVRVYERARQMRGLTIAEPA